MLILWILSFVIFWGYAALYIDGHGIPVSWSDTFYRLQEFSGKKNRGYILTGVLWAMSLCMLPITLDKHPFMFLVLALIMFIGAAPAFNNNKLEYLVHMAGSIGSVTTAIIAFAAFYHLYVLAGVLALAVALMYLKIVKVKNYIMWIESITIFSGHMIVLFKDILKL